jgi:hypothetical protein
VGDVIRIGVEVSISMTEVVGVAVAGTVGKVLGVSAVWAAAVIPDRAEPNDPDLTAQSTITTQRATRRHRPPLSHPSATRTIAPMPGCGESALPSRSCGLAGTVPTRELGIRTCWLAAALRELLTTN